MLEKSKKFAFYFLVILLSSFIFKEISDYLDKQKFLENLRYTDNTLENFYIVSKSNQTYILKGSKMIDKKDEYFIENPVLQYFGEKGSFTLTSEKGLYNNENKTAKFYENVSFQSKDVQMKTEYITIDTQKKLAYNDLPTTVSSKNMITTGKNLFLDFDKEVLKLDNVNTQIRGRND